MISDLVLPWRRSYCVKEVLCTVFIPNNSLTFPSYHALCASRLVVTLFGRLLHEVQKGKGILQVTLKGIMTHIFTHFRKELYTKTASAISLVTG